MLPCNDLEIVRSSQLGLASLYLQRYRRASRFNGQIIEGVGGRDIIPLILYFSSLALHLALCLITLIDYIQRTPFRNVPRINSCCCSPPLTRDQQQNLAPLYNPHLLRHPPQSIEDYNMVIETEEIPSHPAQTPTRPKSPQTPRNPSPATAAAAAHP